MEGSATPWIEADLVIKGASEVLTCKAGARDAQGRLTTSVIADGAVAARDGHIVWVGSEAALMEEVRLMRGGEMLDADGRLVMPGLVDCHTHLAWAGDRADEFQLRVAGTTYQQVQEAGGGIPSTVHATRNATDEVLRALTRKRLDRFLRYGVTTVEAKSGYGLSLDQELRHLEVYREVAFAHAVDVVPTLLAAHVVPVDYADRPDEYVKLIVKKIIPAAAKRKLAHFCDAFCERGAFTVDQCRAVLEAGLENDLQPDPHSSTLRLEVRFGVNPDYASTRPDGPDNITVAPYGGLILAEDGEGASCLQLVTRKGRVFPLARNARDDGEWTGPCFSPDGRTLFANLQEPAVKVAITGNWSRLGQI